MDLLIRETGNGGDVLLRGNDLATVTGIENMPYIAMFGGGDNNWWGNSLLYATRPQFQYLSYTEQIIDKVPLSSAGRLQIEQAVKKDMEFLKKLYPGTAVNVTVRIGGSNRLEILLNIDGTAIAAIWNPDISFLTYQVQA